MLCKVLTVITPITILIAACSGSVQGPQGDPDSDDPREAKTDPKTDPKTGLPTFNPAEPCRVAVPMRRLTETQYRNAVAEVFKGQAVLPQDFALPKLGSPESGFSSDPNYNAVDLAAAREFNSASIDIPITVVSKLATLLPCSSTPSESCAQQFVAEYGRRAFRRALTDREKGNLLKAFKLGTGTSAFSDGIAAVVSNLLQSPQFLYEYEVGDPVQGEDKILRLKGHEIASRLAFTLWDSSPDESLLAAAEANDLSSSDGIREQADRMLKDPRARSALVRFVREWTHFEVPKVGDRSDPAFNQALATGVQSEFDDFVARMFLDDNGSLEKLLTSPENFRNATVSKFYADNGGLGPRSGLLTQPALLTGFAGPGDTSPIRRSVFVRHKLTCEDFPPPPNDAADVEAKLPLPADASQRDRSVERNKSTRCSGCHTLIDPLGFGFESFDELGRYRTNLANGKRIDSSGDVIGPVSDDLAGTFDTLPTLGSRLAKSPRVQACVSRQLFRFSYGRLDGDGDSCATQGLAKRVLAEKLSLREFVLGFVTADEFRFRRAE